MGWKARRSKVQGSVGTALSVQGVEEAQPLMQRGPGARQAFLGNVEFWDRGVDAANLIYVGIPRARIWPLHSMGILFQDILYCGRTSLL